MPHHSYGEDDWDSDSDVDDAFDDPDAIDDEGEEPMVACPYCKHQIHEEAQRCPYCEQYISEEDAPYRWKPLWILVGAVICIYLVLRWAF